jgi:hypothetical protein
MVHLEQSSQLNDMDTIYSYASSLPAFQKTNFMFQFAKKLLEDIFTKGPSNQSLQWISDLLPGILRAFALKFGYKLESQRHRDVMFYIHKNRR